MYFIIFMNSETNEEIKQIPYDIGNVPDDGDMVVLKSKCYVVSKRRFNFDTGIIRIYVEDR